MVAYLTFILSPYEYCFSLIINVALVIFQHYTLDVYTGIRISISNIKGIGDNSKKNKIK